MNYRTTNRSQRHLNKKTFAKSDIDIEEALVKHGKEYLDEIGRDEYDVVHMVDDLEYQFNDSDKWYWVLQRICYGGIYDRGTFDNKSKFDPQDEYFVLKPNEGNYYSFTYDSDMIAFCKNTIENLDGDLNSFLSWVEENTDQGNFSRRRMRRFSNRRNFATDKEIWHDYLEDHYSKYLNWDEIEAAIQEYLATGENDFEKYHEIFEPVVPIIDESDLRERGMSDEKIAELYRIFENGDGNLLWHTFGGFVVPDEHRDTVRDILETYIGKEGW